MLCGNRNKQEDKIMKKSKKIGILTFYNAMNYGAILQCYALQTKIQDMGYDVEVLDYTPLYFNKVFFDPLKPWKAFGFKNKIKAFIKTVLKYNEMKNVSMKYAELKRFISENIILSKPFSKDTVNYYSTIIAGSDQIWNLELLKNDTTYLLDFDTNIKKISYAASFKVSDVDEYAKNAYRRFLPEFFRISVRENNLREYLKGEYNIEATSVLDPTLLVDKGVWNKFIYNKRVVQNKYLLIYHVNRPVNLIKDALQYAKEHGLSVVSLNKINDCDDYIDCSNASIEEFLCLIKNAEAVFTTSFHGLAFSVIFRTDVFFEVPENSYNNNERLVDLASKLGLLTQNIALEKTVDKINWEQVDIKLNQYREISLDFLKEALYEESH